MRPEYPKRIFVQPWNKNAAKWQKFFDDQYEYECKRLGLPIESPLL